MKKRCWTILFALVALGGGTLWLLLGRVPIREGRCRLRHRTNQDREPIAFLVSQMLLPVSSGPDDVKNVPADIRCPSYYHLAAGGKQVALAVDFSGTLRMCIDADGDGILSNERCHSAHLVKSRDEKVTYRNKFGPLSLATGDRQQQTTARFNILSYRRDRPGPLWVYPAGYRYGRLRLGGKTYAIAVIDGDYDGRYKTTVSLPVERLRQPQCDVFAIDLNGDGRFQQDDTRDEIAPLSRMVLIEGTYYAVDIADNGARLELRPVQPALGQLVIDPSNALLRLRLWSDTASQCLAPDAREWRLPAGEYQTTSAALYLRDPNGNEWTFSMAREFGALGSFEIRTDQTTRLRAGPPFVVKADVRAGSPGVVSISPVIIGCAGEQYQADFRCNGRHPPERAFKIVDEKGNVLVADKFQYG